MPSGVPWALSSKDDDFYDFRAKNHVFQQKLHFEVKNREKSTGNGEKSIFAKKLNIGAKYREKFAIF